MKTLVCSFSRPPFVPPPGLGVAPPSEVAGWKRCMDLGMVVILSLVVVIPLLLAMLWIALNSPGPVLFRQVRVGVDGRRFIIFKLRTMRPGSTASLHHRHVQRLIDANEPLTKLDDLLDPRLIPGGRFLRASGMDELPQLINVLRGDMSLVGPRPCLPWEARFVLPEHAARFSVLPGITGPWQLGGARRGSFQEMARLDTGYAANLSLLRDLSILLGTPAAIWRQLRQPKAPNRRGPLKWLHPMHS